MEPFVAFPSSRPPSERIRRPRSAAWRVFFSGIFLLCIVLSAAVVAAGQEAPANDTTGSNEAMAGDRPDNGTFEAITGPPARNADEILLALGYLLVATGALALLIWSVLAGTKRLARGIEARMPEDQGPLTIGSFRILSTTWIRPLLVEFTLVTRTIIIAIAVLAWLSFTFGLFAVTAGYESRLVDVAITALKGAGSSFLAYLPDLVYLIVVVVLARVVLKVINFVFEGIARGKITLRNFQRSWARTTYKLVRFFVIIFVFVIIFPRLPGTDSAAFQGISIFLGAVLTIGGSSAVANIISGIVLTYSRAFEKGDRVRISETEGDVVHRSLLVTRIRTIKRVEVTIPNAQVLSSHIINYSTQADLRGLTIHTTVSIGYEVPWTQVEALLLEAARRTEAVLDDPRPFVLHKALGDNAVEYEINGIIDDARLMAEARSDLHKHILDAFAEAKVEILSPAYRAIRQGDASTVPRSEAIGPTSPPTGTDEAE